MREEEREWRRRGREISVGWNFGIPVERVVVLVAVACVRLGTSLACGLGCSTRYTCTMVLVSL